MQRTHHATHGNLVLASRKRGLRAAVQKRQRHEALRGGCPEPRHLLFPLRRRPHGAQVFAELQPVAPALVQRLRQRGDGGGGIE